MTHLPERIWLDRDMQPWRVLTIEMTDLPEYRLAPPATAQGVDFTRVWEAGRDAAAEIAKHFAELDYCAMNYPEDGGIAASGTAHEIELQIRAITPPVPAPWMPPEDRPDGFECLGALRVEGVRALIWTHVYWQRGETAEECVWMDPVTLMEVEPVRFAQLPAPEASK